MSSLKVVTVLASVCVLVLAQDELSDDHMQIVLGFHKECKSESNISDNLASGVLAGDFPDDPILKQHLLCMSKKFGALNDGGEVQEEVIKEKIIKVVKDEDRAEELTKLCAVEKGSPEETAFEMTKCIYEGTHS